MRKILISSEDELHYTNWLTIVIPSCSKTLELDLGSFLGKKLIMKHVEHKLCDYDEYFRLAAGESQGGRIYQPRDKSSARQYALALLPEAKEMVMMVRVETFRTMQQDIVQLKVIMTSLN